MKQHNRILSLMLAILLAVGMVSISTLTAAAADTYTVTFDVGDGTGTVAPMTGVFDTVAHFPEGPTPPEGMAFYAWVEDVNTETYQKTGSSFRIKKNTTYHAVYFPVEGLFTYRINQDDVTVMECVQSATGEVVVPGTYAGKPVTKIYRDAFKHCSTITSVVLPESIMEIDNHAFDNCNQMESTELPNHLMKFGLNVFIHCEALKSIVLPRGSEYGFGMFGNCISLEEITLPDDMSYIPQSFFFNCISLTELTVPASVQIIEYEAFAGCINLEKLVLPEGLLEIDYEAFAGCDALTEIIIPRSVNRLYDYTFWDYNGTVLVYEGSYAHTFCEENGIAYALVPSVQVGQVTLENGDYTTDGQSITTTKPESGGYAHFENGVLTLHNFTYSGSGGNGAVIYSTSDLTINAVGTNTINSDEKYAIYLKGGDLTIEGDVLDLAVRDAEKALTTVFLYDVDGTYGKLTITDVTLNIDNNGDDQTYGIRCEDVLIDGSTLNVTMKKERQHRGSGLDASGTVAIVRNSQVVIDLSEVTNGTALIADGNVSVSDSYVELRGDANGGTGLSFNTSYRTLDFNGGTLIISGTRDPGGAIYMFSATIELPDGDYWWRTDENGTYSKGDSTYNKSQTYIELTTTDPHTHSYTRKTNDTQHWMECACGVVLGGSLEDHKGGTATCAAKAKCSVCGEEYGDYGAHDWNSEWTTDSEKHWHTCLNTGCAEVADENLHSGGSATCKDPAKCEFCDTPYGQLLAHSYQWVVDQEPTTSAPGVKHEQCVCGAKRSENTPIPQITTPPTGDSSQNFLWGVLALSSALALGGLSLSRKKIIF